MAMKESDILKSILSAKEAEKNVPNPYLSTLPTLSSQPLGYDPLASKKATFSYDLGADAQLPPAPDYLSSLTGKSSDKKKMKFTGAGANIFTALDALFGLGSAVTTQIANWTDGKADWKDIPLAEPATFFKEGIQEAWKDGEFGLKDNPLIGGLAAITEKGKQGKDLAMQWGAKDRPGKFDLAADLGGFGLDFFGDPLTYAGIGVFTNTVKLATKGVRAALPALVAKYGLKGYKPKGRNIQKIITRTTEDVFKTKNAEYVSKGASPQLADRYARRDADNALNELTNLANQSRREAEQYLVTLDVPFTRLAKGVVKRPSALVRKDIPIGAEAGALITAKLVEKGMPVKEISRFLSNKFEGLTDPAQMSRGQADYFYKEIERFPVPQVPNPKVTEKLMKDFPKVAKEVEEAVEAFKGKGKPQAVKPTVAAATQGTITIAREGRSFKDAAEAKTYGEVADFVKANLTDISKGDASSLDGVIRSQFGVTRETARSMINQLKNDGVLVASKKPNVTWEVNKDAIASSLLTKKDIDKQISTDNDTLLNVAKELVSLGRLSDTKNDKTVIENFVRAYDEGGKGLTQKQIDNVRRRVSKYTGQLVGKVTSTTGRSAQATLQGMQDRSGARALVQKTEGEIKDIKTRISDADKILKDTKASAVTRVNSYIKALKDGFDQTIKEARDKKNAKQAKLTENKKKLEKVKLEIPKAQAKVDELKASPDKDEVLSVDVKPLTKEQLRADELPTYNKKLTDKSKNEYLLDRARSRFADVHGFAYDKKTKTFTDFRIKFMKPEEKTVYDSLKTTAEKIEFENKVKQRLLEEFTELRAKNRTELQVATSKLNGLKLQERNLPASIAKAEADLTVLKENVAKAVQAKKDFDEAGYRLSALASDDAIKVAESDVATLKEILNAKQLELDEFKKVQQAPQSIPEAIRQILRPTPTAPARVAPKERALVKPTFAPKPEPVKKGKGKVESPEVTLIKKNIADIKKSITETKKQLESNQKLEQNLRTTEPSIGILGTRFTELPKTLPASPKTAEELEIAVAVMMDRLKPYLKSGSIAFDTDMKLLIDRNAKLSDDELKKVQKFINKRQGYIDKLEKFVKGAIPQKPVVTATTAPSVTQLPKTLPRSPKTKEELEIAIAVVESRMQPLLDKKVIIKQNGKNVVNTASNISKTDQTKATKLLKQYKKYKNKYKTAPKSTKVTQNAPNQPVTANTAVEQITRQADNSNEAVTKLKGEVDQLKTVIDDAEVTVTKREDELTAKILKLVDEWQRKAPERADFKLNEAQQKVYDKIKSESGKLKYFEEQRARSEAPKFQMSDAQRKHYNSLPEEPDIKPEFRRRNEYMKRIKQEYYNKQKKEYFTSKVEGVKSLAYTPAQLRQIENLQLMEDSVGKFKLLDDYRKSIEADAIALAQVRLPNQILAEMKTVLTDRQKLSKLKVNYNKKNDELYKAMNEAVNAQQNLNRVIPDTTRILEETRTEILQDSAQVLELESRLNKLEEMLKSAEQILKQVPTANVEQAIEQIMNVAPVPKMARGKLNSNVRKVLRQQVKEIPKRDNVDLTDPQTAVDATRFLDNVFTALDDVAEQTPNAPAVTNTVDKIDEIVQTTPQIVSREVEFIPRTDAARIINSNFKSFSKDMVGRSKLYSNKFLNNKFFNPRSLSLGHTLPETFGKDISKTDVKLYGRKYEMMEDVKKIQKMANKLSAEELDSIIYFMQKSYPNKMKPAEYFVSRGIDADGVERIKEISIAMGKMFKKIGNEQQQAQLLGMLRSNYFPHVYKLSDGESEELLRQYEDDPIVKQLMGRSQKDGFSNSRKSFQTLAEFDDYLAGIQKKIDALKIKPSLTDDESAELLKLQQKHTDLSDVIERNPITALSRRYYKSIVSTTNAELNNGLKRYGLIVQRNGNKEMKRPTKDHMQLDAQQAGLLGLKSGDFIHRDIFNGLKRIEGVFTDEGINNIINQMNSIQNIWKQAVTTIIPKYYITNLVGNIFNNTMAGVGIDSYAEAGKIILAMKKGNLNPAQKQLIRDAIDNGVLYQGWQADFRNAADFKAKKDLGTTLSDSIAKLDQTVMKGITFGKVGKKVQNADGTYKKARQPEVGLGGYYKRSLEKFGDLTDDFSRLAHFIDMIGKTNSVELAADSVKKYLFNYREATRLDKFLRGSVFPFWMWTRNNIPLYLDQLMRQPRFILAYMRFKKEFQGGDLTPDDVPPWASEAGLVRGTTMIPTNLPINDLYKTMNSPAKTLRDAGAMLNPILKMGIELGLNKKFFTGGMAYYPGTEARDFTRYILQMFGPLGKLPAEIFFPTTEKTSADIMNELKNLIYPVPVDLEKYNR